MALLWNLGHLDIVLAAPCIFDSMSDEPQRCVALSDGRIELIPEAEFQQRIATQQELIE